MANCNSQEEAKVYATILKDLCMFHHVSAVFIGPGLAEISGGHRQAESSSQQTVIIFGTSECVTCGVCRYSGDSEKQGFLS